MKRELKDNNIQNDIQKHTISKQDDLDEFNLLFKTKHEFKYDKFDKLLGNIDWDTYIDNIYEKRKEYLREINLITSNVMNTNTRESNFEQNWHKIEETVNCPINPINIKERNAAYIKLLIQIYNLIVNRAIKTYMNIFINKLKHISNKRNINKTIEIITISSDEEDIAEIPDDNNFININKWTFQYQDTRIFGIDTEENIIEEKNEIKEYLNWINSEINISDNKEYILSLLLQQAYIIFKPNNVIKNISFGIEIYKTLQNTIFENYIEDIITFYTSFNLEQILVLKNYEIFKNNKLNEWLTKEIDKNNLIQTIRISISTDTHQSKDTKEEHSEDSSEKITEAK